MWLLTSFGHWQGCTAGFYIHLVEYSRACGIVLAFFLVPRVKDHNDKTDFCESPPSTMNHFWENCRQRTNACLRYFVGTLYFCLICNAGAALPSSRKVTLPMRTRFSQLLILTINGEREVDTEREYVGHFNRRFLHQDSIRDVPGSKLGWTGTDRTEFQLKTGTDMSRVFPYESLL